MTVISLKRIGFCEKELTGHFVKLALQQECIQDKLSWKKIPWCKVLFLLPVQAGQKDK